MTRYNANGSLDATFGTAGKARIDFLGSNDFAYGLAIQADGKIVIVGAAALGVKFDFGLARLLPNGTLDTTFDGDGKVMIDSLSDDEVLTDIVILPGGDLIVVGERVFLPTTDDFTIIRVKPNGTLVTTFGTGGIVQTDFGGASNDKSLAVALQPDGKIVVVGSTNVGSIFPSDFAAARYNAADGSLDATFDADGKVTVSFGSLFDGAFDVAIGADGNPVLAGFLQTSASDFDFALARLKADGSLDTAFDGDGRATISFGVSEEAATALAIQTDGKIVAAGYSYASPPNFALARFNYDGSPDSFFGTSGKTTTDFGGTDFGRGIAIQTDGKIVVAGTAEDLSDTDFALARYNSALGSTAGDASISGRVTTADGRGIRNARLILTDGAGQSRHAQSGPFGYYRIDDLPVGESYVLTVYSKRFVFGQPSIFVHLMEDLTDVDFTALP